MQRVRLTQLLTGDSAFKLQHDYFTMQQVVNFPHALSLSFPPHVPKHAQVCRADGCRKGWLPSHTVPLAVQDFVLLLLQRDPRKRLGAGGSAATMAALKVRGFYTVAFLSVWQPEFTALCLTRATRTIAFCEGRVRTS